MYPVVFLIDGEFGRNLVVAEVETATNFEIEKFAFSTAVGHSTDFENQ